MTITERQNFIPTRCPRCKAQLWWGNDQHGEHLFCYSCGYYRDLTDKIGYRENHSFIQEAVPEMSRLDTKCIGGYAQEVSSLQEVV